MPDADVVVEDLVRGEIRFPQGTVPDFAVVRANGDPLYTLVNPVDDALMGITHVLRGEDLLSSTPRQVALYEALHQVGIGTGAPRFGHLPYVMGEGNKKLSKRDPESNLLLHRERGFLPEGLLNYLALLGWGIAEDRDVFTLAEMVAGVRRGRRGRQPRPLRRGQGRGHQRPARPGAAGGRARPPARAVPGRLRLRPADPAPAGAARRRDARWSRSG